MSDTPDIQALKEVFVATLEASTDLGYLVAAITNARVPSHIAGEPYDWSLPVLVYGVQFDQFSTRNTYASKGIELTMRLQAFDRGSAPGAYSFKRCYQALAAADTALQGIPADIDEMHTLYFRRESGIPELLLEEPGKPLQMQVGALYSWWVASACP